MSKLLYIKANDKTNQDSRTFRISESFIEAYKKGHPGDEVVTLDLYKENIEFLTFKNLENMDLSNREEDKKHPILKYTFQFLEADKYVIAEPLWNLGVPAILKAYIDYICINNVTFKYTEKGPEGLCKGKKAVNITTRGGVYSNGNFKEKEMADKYLKIIFEFLGVEDFVTVYAEGLDYGNDISEIMDNAIKQAQDIAKSF